VVAPSAAYAATSVSFTTAGCSTWSVPAGVTSLAIQAVGAAGTAGYGSSGKGAKGDGVTATLSVSPGEILDVCVDVGGGPGGTNGFGTGGGASGVSIGTDFTQPVLVAGGGGGGGDGFTYGGSGGAPGLPAGSAGGNGDDSAGGGGGTASKVGSGNGGGSDGHTFGAAGPGQGGTGGAGGFGGGGGGGAGYNGGGGGGDAPVTPPGGGGGGGGSDFCTDTASVTGCTVSPGAGTGTSAGASPGDAMVTLASPLVITTHFLPFGYQGQFYSAGVSTSGGIAPRFWSITSGAPPRGLGINSSTGVISGRVSASGLYIFTVTVTDSSSPVPQSANMLFSIVIIPGFFNEFLDGFNGFR